jgi:ribose 5-phosphate isomerase B
VKPILKAFQGRGAGVLWLTMRPVITERDIPAGGTLRVAIGTIITPSARDLARERRIEIVEMRAEDLPLESDPARIVAIGSDHGGFEMKELLKPIFEELGLTVRDAGVYEAKPADYPDIAAAVAELVSGGAAARGVIVDGAGIGSAIVANKFPGIRAALCYDKASARNSREHNDSNVLTLGGRLLTPGVAADVLRLWLTTPFAGGRHAARVNKITEIEKKHLK